MGSGVVGAMEFDAGAVALLVGSAAFAVLFAVYFVVRWTMSFPDLPAPGPETSELGPDPESPAVANLLVNRCKVTSAAAAATLLDLAARGHLELFGAGPERFVVRIASAPGDPLAAHEEQVMALVRQKATGGSAPLEAIELETPVARGWRKDFAEKVVAAARARGLVRARWARADWIGFGVLAAVALLLLGLALAVADLAAPEPPSTSSDNEEPGFWFVAVAGVAWFALMSVIRWLGSLRYSDAGLGAASRWLGVKRFLQDDAAFGDTPPSGVAIWDRLLAYGAAVGAARAAVAGIPLEEEDPDVAWSRVGGTWHQVSIEYPTRFSYGARPSSAVAQGLLRTVAFGALAFVVLPIVVDVVWSAGADALRGDAGGAVLAIGLVFGLVVAALGVVFVVALGDGLVRLARGVADLGAIEEVVGEVVKHHETTDRNERTISWFAVDPGDVDEVIALRPGDDAEYPPRRATVRVVVTPRLRHVVSVDVLERAS
jgi:Predicted membrane protein (DUF2207)